MTAYYNESDPYAAQWLRNLIQDGQIASGDVDERSIVRKAELAVTFDVGSGVEVQAVVQVEVPGIHTVLT